MPLSYECKQKHIKQNPWKPTTSKRVGDAPLPGPMAYEQPEIIGGKGFSHIKRSPAYTFGLKTAPLDQARPILTKNAPMFNIRGFNKKGRERITHGVVSPRIRELQDPSVLPGPGAYDPHIQVSKKKPPAYTMQGRPKGPKKSRDVWTPSANMYCPPIPCKRPPTYSIGTSIQKDVVQATPGPGDHNPNFNYVAKGVRGVLFGRPFKPDIFFQTPSPNYCTDKLNYTKKRSPAPSFGIKHSPYLGETTTFTKSSKLNLVGDDR